MIISVEFKNGIAEIKVISALKDSELKELPHFVQALLSTKFISIEDVLGELGKDDTEDTGYITDNNKNSLKGFNNEKLYGSNVNFADKVKKPENISTSNKKVPMSVTLEKLYKEYAAAKAEYSEYRTLHNILLDIAGEPDISDADIETLNAKIKMCKMKRDAVGRAYKALIAFIESIDCNDNAKYSNIKAIKTSKNDIDTKNIIGTNSEV